MGVDCKFYVRPKIGPREIITALEALGKKNVRYEHTHDPSYVTIYFDRKNGDGQRMISFFFNLSDEYFGMNCNLLSLRANEESEEVFRQLAEMFGGILQPSDCTDDCEMYSVPGSGNIRWLIEQYFAKHPNAPDDCDKQIQDFTDFAVNRWNK